MAAFRSATVGLSDLSNSFRTDWKWSLSEGGGSTKIGISPTASAGAFTLIRSLKKLMRMYSTGCSTATPLRSTVTCCTAFQNSSALVASGGNVSRVARRLGLARSTLRYRIGIHGLESLIPTD